jgi:hypothetical protein
VGENRSGLRVVVHGARPGLICPPGVRMNIEHLANQSVRCTYRERTSFETCYGESVEDDVIRCAGLRQRMS